MEDTKSKVTVLDIFNQKRKLETAKRKVRSEEQKLLEMVKEAGEYLHQKLVVKGTLYDVTASCRYFDVNVEIENLGSVENLQKLFESGQ